VFLLGSAIPFSLHLRLINAINPEDQPAISPNINKMIFLKEHRLFIVLACFFIGNTLIAEVIGPKMFSLEKSLGMNPLDFNLFGIEHISLNFSAGSILWPIVFIMTDIINEYYGRKGVRFLTYTAVGIISYAFFMLLLTTKTAPADFWLKVNADISPDINTAFTRIFGTSMWIIIGSLIAFLVSQLIDALFFYRFKRYTGNKMIWLRATGSTMISQFFDSFLILFIVFYIGADASQRWSFNQIAAMGMVAYTYKVLTAVLLLPVLYFVHGLIERYLGKEKAAEMKISSM
jgi:queuosine precursor transporter